MNASRTRREVQISFAATLAGVSAALLAFNLIVFAYGERPRELLGLVFEGTWGSAYGIGQVLFKATPLLFAGVAVDVALRAGLFNIGGEGQMAVASLVVGALGAQLPAATPPPLAVIALTALAAAAGALWALVPALLKARYGAHEVISTIMMNRIADAAIGLALGLGLAEIGTVRTRALPEAFALPRLDSLFESLRGSAVSYAVVFALGSAAVMAVANRTTRLGRESFLVGKNPTACAACGIPVRRRLVQALLLSGAIAGLGSLGTVLGYKGYFERGLGAGAGFGGIAVALLGRGSLPGLVLAALLFGTLQQGGLAINAHVPMEVMDVLQGVVIAGVAVADARVRAAFARFVPRPTRGAA